MFIASFVMGIAAYLAAPLLLNLIDTPAEALQDATIYMRMSCIGVPLVAVYNYSSSMLRSLGDSKTPLYFLIFSCFLNIALDLFCVKTLGLGVFGAALATYADQNWDAGKMDRVKDGLKHGMLLSAVFTVIIMAAYQLLGGAIMSTFVKETEVIELGVRALKLTSWFYIFLAAIYMSRGILNGVGDAMFAFINGIVEAICRLGLPILLVALIPQIGRIGIWWTACITWVISSAFCMLRYVVWRKKAALPKVPSAEKACVLPDK